MIKQEIKTMYFVDMIFRDGLNLTIRRGTKWDGYRGDIILRKCPIRKGKGDEIKNGKVIKTMAMRFADIGKVRDYLLYEHDEQCRTLPGLRRMIHEFYSSFATIEIVTLVFFYTDDRDNTKAHEDLENLFYEKEK